MRMANSFPAFPGASSGTASLLKPQPWASEDSLNYAKQLQSKSRSPDCEHFHTGAEHTEKQYGGSCLQSLHLGGGDKRTKSSRPALATQRNRV